MGLTKRHVHHHIHYHHIDEGMGQDLDATARRKIERESENNVKTEWSSSSAPNESGLAGGSGEIGTTTSDGAGGAGDGGTPGNLKFKSFASPEISLLFYVLQTKCYFF